MTLRSYTEPAERNREQILRVRLHRSYSLAGEPFFVSISGERLARPGAEEDGERPALDQKEEEGKREAGTVEPTCTLVSSIGPN